MHQYIDISMYYIRNINILLQEFDKQHLEMYDVKSGLQKYHKSTIYQKACQRGY
jgi:hypothetical protein